MTLCTAYPPTNYKQNVASADHFAGAVLKKREYRAEDNVLRLFAPRLIGAEIERKLKMSRSKAKSKVYGASSSSGGNRLTQKAPLRTGATKHCSRARSLLQSPKIKMTPSSKSEKLRENTVSCKTGAD